MNRTGHITILAILLGMATAAKATPVTIDNSSFELPATTTFDFAVTGWFEETKTADDAREAVQDNASNVNVPQTVFGSQWANLSDTGAIYQEIDTFAANTAYTFSGLLLGDRSNKLFGSLNVELWVGNGVGAHNTALSSFATLADSANFDITETGSPATLAVSDFTLNVGDAFTAGDAIWLRFSSVDGGGTAGDSQVLFDNINIISATPASGAIAVPEPSSVVLIAVGLAGLLLHRRAT